MNESTEMPKARREVARNAAKVVTFGLMGAILLAACNGPFGISFGPSTIYSTIAVSVTPSISDIDRKIESLGLDLFLVDGDRSKSGSDFVFSGALIYNGEKALKAASGTIILRDLTLQNTLFTRKVDITDVMVRGERFPFSESQYFDASSADDLRLLNIPDVELGQLFTPRIILYQDGTSDKFDNP